MEYPEKLYVADTKDGRPEWDFYDEERRYDARVQAESHAVLNSEEEVAVYQFVGKMKLVNKTVLAEPEA